MIQPSHTQALYLVFGTITSIMLVHGSTTKPLTEPGCDRDTGRATFTTCSRYDGTLRAAKSVAEHAARSNLTRLATVPSAINRGDTGRATDAIHCRFTDAANYLRGFHYLNRNGSGHHFRLGQAALILAILGIRSTSCSTQAQRLGIRAERRHELEKHDGKAEMNLHG
jgi:hypothetical protein